MGVTDLILLLTLNTAAVKIISLICNYTNYSLNNDIWWSLYMMLELKFIPIN